MSKNPLFIIFLVVFIDLLGFGIIIPILPYYAESYGASATVIGWLMMSYSGMQFLFSPFWGRLSDRVGRRPVILVSVLGIGLSMIMLAYAPSLIWLFVARILAGFFGANISAASAYIADVTPPDKRAKGMGMIGAAFGLGFLFGPALGGLLSKWGYGTAALFAAGLAILNFIFAIYYLKEPPISEAERQQHRHRVTRQSWQQTFSNPRTGLVIFLFFLVTLGLAQIETVFALFLLARFKLDAFHAGLILGLMGLIMVLIQGGAIGRLVKRFGEVKLVIGGCGLMALSLLGASFSFLVFLFVLLFAIYAMGYAMTNPSLMSLVSRHAQKGMQGGTMGIYQSAGSLARIVGPLMAGVLFDRLGIHIPFVVAAGFFMVSLMIVFLKRGVW